MLATCANTSSNYTYRRERDGRIEIWLSLDSANSLKRVNVSSGVQSGLSQALLAIGFDSQARFDEVNTSPTKAAYISNVDLEGFVLRRKPITAAKKLETILATKIFYEGTNGPAEFALREIFFDAGVMQRPSRGKKANNNKGKLFCAEASCKKHFDWFLFGAEQLFALLANPVQYPLPIGAPDMDAWSLQQLNNPTHTAIETPSPIPEVLAIPDVRHKPVACNLFGASNEPAYQQSEFVSDERVFAESTNEPAFVNHPPYQFNLGSAIETGFFDWEL